jgi:imidazolonepropionase-like amidohydrolase
MSKTLITIIIAVALIASLYLASTRKRLFDKSQSPILAITGAMVVAGTNQPPLTDAVILIEGGKISRIFHEGEGAIPDRAQVIKADGCTVIPGLIDCSVGLVIGSGGSAISHHEFMPDRIVRDLRSTLYWGVTTVCSSEDPLPLIRRLRDNEREDLAAMPRLYISGPVLTAVGGWPAAFLPTQVAAESTRQLNYHDQVEAVINDLAAENVDIIKVVYDGGNKLRQYPKLDPDMLGRLVEQAHGHGLRVSAQMGTTQELKDAVRAGVDAVEHRSVDALDAEAIRLMTEHDIYYCPTLEARRIEAQSLEEIHDLLAREDVRLTVSAEVRASLASRDSFLAELKRDMQSREYLNNVWDVSRGNLLKAARGGVKIISGSGAGQPAVFHGLALHEELRLMVEAGISPAQALMACTRTAAEYIGADAVAGTLEVGKNADVLILDRNPLEDITATKDIWQVIKGGRLIDRGQILR